jgi:translation initiation factor eIF-2B subunit delta
VRALINEIAADNQSGAAQILARAADVFSLLEAQSQSRAAVAEACVALVRAQPLMSPLVNLANRVLAAAEATTASAAASAAAEAARAYVAASARAADLAASRAAELISPNATALTHSSSSTVLAAFIKAIGAGKRFRVIVTESRPGLEGRALAESLAREGADVTIMADAAIALATSEADLAIVGADSVTPASVINKVGTRLVALAARERGRPIYALCDASKLISISDAAGERRSDEELWPGAPRDVAVVNRYFEPTPLSYFTAIITEAGLLSPGEVGRLARSIRINEALSQR